MNYSLQPAYGRDYKTGREAVEAFGRDVDFVHASSLHTGGGSYINASQIPYGARVSIRYARDRKQTSFVRGREPSFEVRPRRVRLVPLFDLRLKREPQRIAGGWRVTFKPRARGYAPMVREVLG